jgi:hypothetical protein
LHAQLLREHARDLVLEAAAVGARIRQVVGVGADAQDVRRRFLADHRRRREEDREGEQGEDDGTLHDAGPCSEKT